MASEKHWVDDNHYRVVSDDKKTSWLYESHADEIFGGDVCKEVAKHHPDGTTTAYEPPKGWLQWGDTGDKKK